MEGRRIRHGVGVGYKDIGEVGRSVIGNEEINPSIIQDRLMHMQVLMTKKLHHIHGSNQMVCRNYGIVLRTGFGIDEKQPISPQTETRECGEEGQIHFSNLMLTSDILRRCLPGDRRQTLRSEDDIDCHTCNHYNRQHNA